MGLSASTPPPSKAFEPTTFGRYQLLGLLGSGGMADVYAARLSAVGGFEKNLVIKRVRPALRHDPAFVGMFLDEARVASRLEHENICQVFELGEVDGEYYMAMEFLSGASLFDLLATVRRAGQQLPVDVVVGMVAQICDGLHHAHTVVDPDGNAIGVLHRDISPHNVFVTTAGIAKVLDFGIAKDIEKAEKTRVSTVKGKDRYMAPEQLMGAKLDARVDVWALGVVLFELLSGRKLFKRETPYQIADAILNDPLPELSKLRPDVPAALEEIARTCLRRNKAERYLSAEALGDALRGCGIEPASKQAIGSYLGDACPDVVERGRRLFSPARGKTHGLGPTRGATISSDEAATVAKPGSSDEAATVARPGVSDEAATVVTPGSYDEAATEAESRFRARAQVQDAQPLPAPPAPALPLALDDVPGVDEPVSEDEAATVVAGKNEPAASPAKAMARPVLAAAERADAQRRGALWSSAAKDDVLGSVASVASSRRGLAYAAAAVALLLLVVAWPSSSGDTLPAESPPSESPAMGQAPPADEAMEAPEKPSPALVPDDVPETPSSARVETPGPSSVEAKPKEPRRAAVDKRAARTDDPPEARREERRRPPRKRPRRGQAAASPSKSTPAAGTGYLAIASSPYATIFIDGKKAGITPIARFALPAGKHRIKAVLESGKSKRFAIDVGADETVRRRLTW